MGGPNACCSANHFFSDSWFSCSLVCVSRRGHSWDQLQSTYVWKTIFHVEIFHLKTSDFNQCLIQCQKNPQWNWFPKVLSEIGSRRFSMKLVLEGGSQEFYACQPLGKTTRVRIRMIESHLRWSKGTVRWLSPKPTNHEFQFGTSNGQQTAMKRLETNGRNVKTCNTSFNKQFELKHGLIKKNLWRYQSHGFATFESLGVIHTLFLFASFFFKVQVGDHIIISSKLCWGILVGLNHGILSWSYQNSWSVDWTWQRNASKTMLCFLFEENAYTWT